MSAVDLEKEVQSLIDVARWHVLHAIPGYSPTEAARALRDLEADDLRAAATRDVCPGWADRVEVTLLAVGENLNQ